MIKPFCLKPGDTVGIVAPSDAVDRGSFLDSVDTIKKWGLKVKIGKHVFARVGDFMAGTPEERIEDLRTMIFDPEVKCIWSATGGYAATEVIPAFSKEVIEHLKANPKMFIGYSDVCLILNALFSFKMVSVQGPTVWGLPEWDGRSQDFLRNIIFGTNVGGIGPEAHWTPVFNGVAEGILLNSDLELLIFSFGTKFDPLSFGGNEDIILSLEELDIEKSTLQRQIDIILNHKRANRIKGIFVGRLVNIRELSYPKWGEKLSPQQLISDRVKKLGIPMAFCDDFGHAEWDYGPLATIKKYFMNRKFYSLPNGVKARLTVDEKNTQLEFLEDICQPQVSDEQPKP